MISLLIATIILHGGFNTFLWTLIEDKSKKYNYILRVKNKEIGDFFTVSLLTMVPGLNLIITILLLKEIKNNKELWKEKEEAKQEETKLMEIIEVLKNISVMYLRSDVEGTYDMYKETVKPMVEEIEKNKSNPVIKYLLHQHKELLIKIKNTLEESNKMTVIGQKEILDKTTELLKEVAEEVNTFKIDNDFIKRVTEQEKIEEAILELDKERKRKPKKYLNEQIRGSFVSATQKIDG